MEGKKIFRTALNGYNKSDVNSFIDHMSEKFKNEKDELQEKIESLEMKILEQSHVISEKQKIIDEQNKKEPDTLSQLLYGQAETQPQPQSDPQPQSEAPEPEEEQPYDIYKSSMDARKIVEIAEEEAKLIKKQLQIKMLSTENSYYETKYKLRSLTEKIDKDICEINKSINEFKEHIDKFTITEILHNKYELEEEKNYEND